MVRLWAAYAGNHSRSWERFLLASMPPPAVLVCLGAKRKFFFSAGEGEGGRGGPVKSRHQCATDYFGAFVFCFCFFPGKGALSEC